MGSNPTLSAIFLTIYKFQAPERLTCTILEGMTHES